MEGNPQGREIEGYGMTSKTMKLGKSSLLSLAGNLEMKITKLVGKRKTKLFCKKHEELITPRFSSEHGCLKPKRIYTNREGKRIVIFCPHLMCLSGKPFYQENEAIIYESLEGIYEVRPEFKPKPEKLETSKEDVFSRTTRNINKIKKAYFELQGSA